MAWHSDNTDYGSRKSTEDTYLSKNEQRKTLMRFNSQMEVNTGK